MKMKVIAMLAALSLTASAAAAQELPRKVNNVEVLDLDGKPAKLPYWGEKNLMIFYVDPDRHKQNNPSTRSNNLLFPWQSTSSASNPCNCPLITRTMVPGTNSFGANSTSSQECSIIVLKVSI